jgi:hypothetical protein
VLRGSLAQHVQQQYFHSAERSKYELQPSVHSKIVAHTKSITEIGKLSSHNRMTKILLA